MDRQFKICHQFRSTRLRTVTRLWYASAVVLIIGLPGCVDQTLDSRRNMIELQLSIANYCTIYKAWPDSLNQLRDIGIMPELDFIAVMKNPLTGDDPGYEYVKPAGEFDDADFDEQQVVLYQLRGGKRDTTLDVLYANILDSGSIRLLDAK